ncbi:hypothetical protein LTS08_000202 [Lithohypha guttulata]|nr:hypothetical protein LTS08_000202 [Lithohypha guttulata]
MKVTSSAAALALFSSLTSASPARSQKRQSQGDLNLDISASLQNILANTHGSELYTYPTDLTRGIIPVGLELFAWTTIADMCYGNQYIRTTITVEADVFLVNGTLYVGHEQSALTRTRTFDALYIQPILSVLQRENPASPFVSGPTDNGVFDTASSQTLYLFVDLKTDGPTTWPVVVRALEPLRRAGYLTRFNGTAVIPGAVTIIGTGNTPLNQVQGVNNRDYFFDANLALLSTTQANITREVSPIASTQFSRYIGAINGTAFNSTQLQTLQTQLQVARQKGIGGRYWDTPAFPISKRNAVWTELERAGAALLNADDLLAAAGFTSEW